MQVPYETGTGLAILGVNNNGQVASFPFTVAPSAPGVFTAPDGSLVPSSTGQAGPARGRLHHRRRRHNHLPDYRREPSQRHHHRPPAAYPPARHRNRGRPACHRDLRRNAHRPGRHLASQLHRPRRRPAGAQAVVITVGGVRTQSGPPHRHSITGRADPRADPQVRAGPPGPAPSYLWPRTSRCLRYRPSPHRIQCGTPTRVT